MELVSFDHLITKDKLEKGDEIDAYLTTKTEFRTMAWADVDVAALSVNDIVQFERKGFFRVDMALAGNSSAVLFSIPTGKTKGC